MQFIVVLCMSLSHVRLFVTSWTVAHQVPPSMEILQARILGWVAMPSSRGNLHNPAIKPRPPTLRQIFFYCLSHQGSSRILEWVAYPFSGRSSWCSYQTRSPALQADSLPAGLPGNFIQLINDPFFRNYNWGRENF